VEHTPVLADEVVQLLQPVVGAGIFVDATVGRAGHARSLLASSSQAQLIGIDRDPDSLEASRSHLSQFGDRVRLFRDDFKNLAPLLERLGVEKVRGVLFDLGVSSSQLDSADRGFSFRADGPLDMRMDPTQSLSASEVVNSYPVAKLVDVISRYGEERFARRIARAVVEARPVSSTSELADIVKLAIPAATRRTGGHPARRTFQAIRIEVNSEVDALETALPAAIDALDRGGRLAVISYHSLEDRVVKRCFAAEARDCTCPPDFPVCVCGAKARIRPLTRRPVRPRPEEIASNPRARAAKLRAVERLGSPGEGMQENGAA
jgi:16S rRNA (cytosine1402-N4)-methyltransferase